MNCDNMEITKTKLELENNLFDDTHYPIYRETNNYILKENLLEILTNDLLEYIKTCPLNTEMRVGYIIYSKLLLGSSKMNNIFNIFIQKHNPNIRIQSLWTVCETNTSSIQIDNQTKIVEVDKIKIKIIVKPNDKDLSIKKLADIILNQTRKHTKKANEYLKKL